MTTSDDDVRYTYTYTYLSLRVAMILLLVMLLFSVGHQWFWETDPKCLLGSISAYYYTPVRPIFVGALCALAVCLVTYRGHSKEEDLLLNFSGFMAAVVALVPTVPSNLCGENAYSQTPDEIASAVRNNIWSLVILTFLGVVVGQYLRRRLRKQHNVAPKEHNTRTIVITAVCIGVLVVEGLLFLISRARFIAVSHYVAALTLVLGVIAVMVFSALRNKKSDAGAIATRQSRPEGAWTPETYTRIYFVIAATLTIVLVATVVVGKVLTDSAHFILIAEVVVIVFFCIYWGVQTRELLDLGSPTLTAIGAEPNESAATAARSESQADGRPIP